MTLSTDGEHVLAQHMPRLQVCLQQVSGSSSGLEKGNDAWLLLNTLTDDDEQNHQKPDKGAVFNRPLGEIEPAHRSALACMMRTF